jgi:hypothetical protein
MFGDRQVACTDEVFGGMDLLMDKLPTWFEFVKEQVNGIECKTGERISFTQVQNVVYNMEHGGLVYYPEIMIGEDIYTDDNDGNDTNANTNTDPINIILAAGALVHEACHVDQIRDGRWFNMSANEAEKECMMAGGDDFYEKLGAPQWLIDWNEGIKDKYRERMR